jgi:hypothetical protein
MAYRPELSDMLYMPELAFLPDLPGLPDHPDWPVMPAVPNLPNLPYLPFLQDDVMSRDLRINYC